jgi:hypothetical protein
MSRSDRGIIALLVLVFASGCTADGAQPPTTGTTAVTPTSTVPSVHLPEITGVDVETGPANAYEMVEMTVGLDALYDNPFDQREVRLDAAFAGPDGLTLSIPGFWDGEGAWRVRFTPTAAGRWDYTVVVTDRRGTSEGQSDSLQVAASSHRGFVRIASDIDPSYSSRYFAHEDGTPWYGRGHADLDMSLGGAAPDGDGLAKFTAMTEIGENYEMWWPMWGSNYIQDSYDNYSPAQMNIIDFVLRDAEAKGIAIVYTIWGHQFLRTAAHEWPDDRWNFNGFSDLTDISGFFTDSESWAWQENYYRYVIGRWGYSPALLMWQTVTEINGTESYEQTDSWHEKVNSYFQEHDPYHHPTTATKSGAQDWPKGHLVMDVPQVHLYHVFSDNPIADTTHFADWTTLMWDRVEAPNWIGEYGNRIQALYPEFMHNANWASLANGAAMTPTEWNDLNAFGKFDDEMAEDMARFARFVDSVPLAVYDPDSVAIQSDHLDIRGWGVIGERGGVVWVQDHALDEATIGEMRADETVRSGVSATVDSLSAGLWTVTPYDTWEGEWLKPFQVQCGAEPCSLPLPDFSSDLALHLSR